MVFHRMLNRRLGEEGGNEPQQKLQPSQQHRRKIRWLFGGSSNNIGHHDIDKGSNDDIMNSTTTIASTNGSKSFVSISNNNNTNQYCKTKNASRRGYLNGGGTKRCHVADTTTGSSSTSGENESNHSCSTPEQHPGSSISNSRNINLRNVLSPSNQKVDPPWNAANFLPSGPLIDSDWWDDHNDIVSSSSSGASHEIYEQRHDSFNDSDDDDDDDESYCSEIRSCISNHNDDVDTNHIELQQYEQDENHNNTRTIHTKRFCNRGLQTWIQTRHVWKTTKYIPPVTMTNTMKPKKSISILPVSFRKELTQCLMDRKQFELSQSIPLSCMINAYQDVWMEHGYD